VGGWLVIVKGPGVGRDYRLISGNNYIGRDPRSEVCLNFGVDSDLSISRRNHALVFFDNIKNEFFMSNDTDSRNLPLLNGQTLSKPKALTPYDKITVGKTELCFVPFCGPNFKW
jgi:hypothetical protein